MLSFRERVALAMTATTNLTKRAGATEFQVGYLIEAPRMEDQGWFALAKWNDKVVKADGRDPIDACTALAIELLDGAICRRCARPIALFAHDGNFCRWQLEGDAWKPECGLPIDFSIPIVAKVDG